MLIEMMTTELSSRMAALFVSTELAATLRQGIQAVLGWIEQTSLSTLLRNSDWAVMGLESIHLLGLALLGGVATLLALGALRRNGLAGLSVPVLARALLPLLLLGLAIMAISGALMVWGMPYKYYLNPAFRWKMLFLVGALLTTAWLARAVRKQASATVLRGKAVLSFLLWLSVGLSGRWIGFF